MAASTDGGSGRSAPIARRIALARWAILWERLLLRLWRAAALLALVSGLTLLGLWSWLPGLLHLALLAAFLLVLAAVAVRDLRGLAWPGEAEARRRLELASGVRHRPLLALDDRQAGNLRDAASRALFEAHRRRMADSVRRPRIGRPRSRVAAADGMALRAVAGLILVAGTIAGWSDARAHLTAAFDPDFARGFGAAPPVAELTLWITPPAHTGVPPLWLDGGGGEPDSRASRAVTVPAGSALFAQMRGGAGEPLLLVDGEPTPFRPAGTGSFEIDHVLDAGGRLAVMQSGREVAAWALQVVPDRAPTVALAEAPRETSRTGLRIDAVARDDYGLKDVVGRFTLVERPREPPLEVLLPIPHPGVRESALPAFFDLMSHPWAGMEVAMRLTARDMIDQTAVTEPAVLTLPERYFHHPAAREIVDRRKAFVRDPATAPAAARALLGLSREPEAFLDDPTVYLALVVAARRLAAADAVEDGAGIVGLMWDTAIAIEEGPLAFAEQRVRDLQRRLLEALAEGVDEREVDRLLEALRQAMEVYMRALSNRLRADPGELFDPTDALKAIGSRDLTDLVDRIRDLVRTGSRDQAQALLTRLREIMENITVGNLADLTGSVSAQAAEVMHTVRQLMTGQQALLDETFRMLRDRPGGAPDNRARHEAQLGLRGALRDMMSRMGEFGFDLSRDFERADRSMTRSARQLGANRPARAIDHQTAAIDRLRAGAEDLMEQLMERAGEEAGGAGINYFAAPRDPMGRNIGGGGAADTSDIGLPDRGALMKAREILEELYRRSSEQHRSVDEQRYLHRLLRRF